MDQPLFYYAILIITGFVAGIINTLAGGGSNLTIPALMITGMPADVANATNRVGVFLQCIVGVKGFHKHGRLDTSDLMPVLIPTLLGGAVGAFIAVVLDVDILKPLLLGTMITMALIVLIFPSVVAPKEGTPIRKVNKTPIGWLGLFCAGIYGGFVQAGVGFILITALAGALRYDLVRSNALKIFCTLVFTGIALLIFIADDLVLWVPGLCLAIGSMAGAAIAVKLALKVSQRVLKWFLFVMTLVASAAAMFSS